MSNSAPANGGLPQVAFDRIGQSTDGTKYIELKVHLDREYSHFFSVPELNHADGTHLLDWLSKENIPVVGKTEGAKITLDLGKKARKALLQNKNIPVLVVDRYGWNGPAFATRYAVHIPDGVAYATAGSFSLLTSKRLKSQLLRLFHRFARRYGRGNPLVRFMLCAGFLGPLLPLLRTEQFWLVLLGAQGKGKSSLLNVAGSIYGGTPRGAIRLLETLSTTENAGETFSAKGRHTLVAFDDTSALPANARERASVLSNIVMRTFGGLEKGRLNQEQRIWESIFMVGSNHSIRKIFEHGNVEYGDYTAVRAIELPVSAKHGIFSRVPSDVQPKDFVKQMVDEALAIRGLAGEYFARSLVNDRHHSERRLKRRLKRWHDELSKRLDPNGNNSDTSRVVDHFASIYAAGRLAWQFGVLPWSPSNIRRAVEWTYRQYMSAKVGVASLSLEDQLLRHVQNNRKAFVRVKQGTKKLPTARVLSRSLGAIFRTKDGATEYCFLPAQLHKVFDVKTPRRTIAAQLAASGLLSRERSGRGRRTNTCKRPICQGSRPRVYVVDAKALKR